MELGPVSAALQYSAAKPATQPDPQGAGVSRTVGAFVDVLNNGEDTARAAMTGGADLPSLVDALARSELAVETAVTVRDKVVEAYQEILRMPV